MITLCGFPISNYYNKVKMALLEKGLPFTEELVKPGSLDEALLSCSPLGKVPFIRTERGALCESQSILEYIEAAHPAPALVPADPWLKGKMHELITFIELHVELVARELYGQAFFGQSLSDEVRQRTRERLVRNIAGLRRLARFAPYVAGEVFTQADCAAFNSLPLVGLATHRVIGEDLLAAGGIDWKGYTQFIGERASAKRIVADRKSA